MTGGRRRAERRRQGRKAKQGPSGNVVAMVIAGVVLVGGLAVGLSLTGGLGGGLAPTVDGIPCHPETVTYHVHSHFEMLVNGQPHVATAGVGFINPQLDGTGYAVSGDCLYELHVHAFDGIIHEEAPQAVNFTLGQFFDIWHKPLSHNRVDDANGPVAYYVNGRLFTGDPRSIVLAAHTVIVAEVGTPVVPPPSFTHWAQSSAGG